MKNEIDEEELHRDYNEPQNVSEPLYLCKCLLSSDSSKHFVLSTRKKKILSTVARTEEYLREREIPELIRFLLTKVIAHAPTNPVLFLQKLIDDCMLFRSGHGQAPVLYEDRHMQAVIKSFDPGTRGWLSSGQVRRVFATLGLAPPSSLGDRIPCDMVLNTLKETQEMQLFKLISAGFEKEDESSAEDFSLNTKGSNNM